MIVITGAAGFIGSNMVSKLNEEGYIDLVLVDDFSPAEKIPNLQSKTYTEKVHRDDFFDWFPGNAENIDFVYHLGARTDTTEFNKAVFDELNLGYSKKVWDLCAKNRVPLVYASSAATYGLGELGYDDDHSLVNRLNPLNPYGESKNEFDKWALEQKNSPLFWAGIKFFNVYGPNEYHKGRMASVVFHAFNQIHETGTMKLFRSHNPEYHDGEQKRDFIYVKDVVDVLFFMLTTQIPSGIYNLGTGKARSFLDLSRAAFRSLGLEEKIEFIDTPEDIRDKYQYFTEAKMPKLLNSGYFIPFSTLEQGVDDYIKFYLQSKKYK
jgi:ADP-L-glycero-D-manno-heptose 6-epimerase